MQHKKVELEIGGEKQSLDIRINDIFEDPIGWLKEWRLLHSHSGKVKLLFDDAIVAE